MIYLLLTILFMTLMALFSGSETGLISLRKSRVKVGMKENDRRAGILNFFIENPGYMLATTLVGTNITLVCASNTARLTAKSFGYEGATPIIIVTIILTMLFLVVEIVPKDWFRQQPYKRCLFFAYFLYSSYIILFIPIRLMAMFTKYISRLTSHGKNNRDNDRGLMREDFSILLRESESANIIDSEAADILDRSLEFHKKSAKNILTPIDSVIEIAADISVADAVVFCQKHQKSRVPVTMNTAVDETSNWKGIFTVYDALFNIPEAAWKKTKVKDCLRPLCIIHENSGMDEILKVVKSSSTNLLIVAENNKEQKHIGIVTLTDVIKVLFG